MNDSIILRPEEECVKEEKDLEFKDLNLLDSGFKEEIKTLPVVLALDDDTCEIKVAVSDLSNKVAAECNNLFEDCKEEADNEGVVVVKKGKKRKNLESCEDEKVKVKVNGRVLRSRTKTGTGSVKVDDSRLNESVVGFKRQMEAECLDQTDLEKEVIKSSPLKGRPLKKQKHKRRGRPPKIQAEAVFKRKKTSECLEKIELQNEVNKSSQVSRGVDKKRKRLGRPPKEKGEDVILLGIQKGKYKDLETENLKRRGRPPKVQEGNMSTNAKQPNVKVVKENKSPSKAKDVKTVSKIQNVLNEDQAFQDIVDKKQKAKITEERNDHTTAEETVKGDNNTKQSKNRSGLLERREAQQFVRDKIVSIIMKAGWTIEYRPRQKRQYLDAVYVDLDGKTNWSITKAYFSLKSKIEKETATSKEVSAYTPIPDDEMSILFRTVSKVRSDKNVKKKKRGKNVSKAEIIFSGEAPPPKKKPGKKKKDGKKRKEINKSSVKSSNKLPGAKVRGPKVTQKGRQIRKPRLVARGSSKGSNKENGEDNALYTGKRNLLSWMIDSGVIKPDDKLQYGEGERRNGLREGTVSCDGVRCSCCAETMDLLKFVSHAGGEATQGLENIYLQSGSSLLKCLLESWRKEEESSKIRFNDVKGDDPSDDTCNICGDGGDLICCDGCPSTFNQSCLDIQNFPSGIWRCIYCSCKFCGLVGCGASQEDESLDAPNPEMLTCCLCEEKFHNLCLQEEDAVNAESTDLSFCGKKCQEIHEQLQMYLGVKFELGEGYSWTLLNRSDVSQVVAILDDRHKIECNSKLAVAFSVMDECFEPIMDERSGVNKIHNVVYNCGSNFKRLDYSGFLTAVLEKDGELISTASIRIHGNRLAEMPFIGTRNMYRRQGMCRRLLDAIENALSSLGVEELVIPAISELYNTWTKVFGFKPLEESIRQAMKGMSMVVFPGTDMLQKRPIKFADKNQSLAPVKDNNALVSEINSSNAVESAERPCEDATHLESETPTTSFQVPVTLVNTSRLTSDVVPKNSFDLNLDATDTDIQSIDDETLSKDTQVCKNTFDLSDSKPLVLV